MKEKNRPSIIAVMAALLIAATIVVFLRIGGDIEYQFGETSLLIHTVVWKDRTVAYDDIDNIELRTDVDVGERAFGYGSSNKLGLQNAKRRNPD